MDKKIKEELKTRNFYVNFRGLSMLVLGGFFIDNLPNKRVVIVEEDGSLKFLKWDKLTKHPELNARAVGVVDCSELNEYKKGLEKQFVKSMEEWAEKEHFKEKLEQALKNIILTGSYDLEEDCFMYGVAFIQLVWDNGKLHVYNVPPPKVILQG